MFTYTNMYVYLGVCVKGEITYTISSWSLVYRRQFPANVHHNLDYLYK